MLIHIDGKFYELPQEVEDRLLHQFFLLFSRLYQSDQVPKALRIAIKPIARHELVKKEKELNKQGLNGKAVRPVRGSDPAIRVMELEIQKFQGGGKLKDVILHIDTEKDTATISAFALSIPNPGESGGSNTISGNVRQWENNGGETTRSSSREIIPYQ